MILFPPLFNPLSVRDTALSGFGVPSAFLPLIVTLSILMSLLISVLIYVTVLTFPEASNSSLVASLTLVLSPSANLNSSLGFTFSSLSLKSAADNTLLLFPTTNPDFSKASATWFPVTNLDPLFRVLVAIGVAVAVPSGAAPFVSVVPAGYTFPLESITEPVA